MSSSGGARDVNSRIVYRIIRYMGIKCQTSFDIGAELTRFPFPFFAGAL